MKNIVLILLLASGLLECKRVKENSVCSPTTVQNQEVEGDSVDLNWQRIDRTYDSLKSVYPEAMIDKMFAEKDSVFKHILLKKKCIRKLL